MTVISTFIIVYLMCSLCNSTIRSIDRSNQRTVLGLQLEVEMFLISNENQRNTQHFGQTIVHKVKTVSYSYAFLAF